MASRVADVETADSAYKSLYRVGGVAALVAVVFILGVAIGFAVYPQPSTVSDWFELFQSSKIIGLLDFWGLEVLGYAMFALVFLALYFALRGANQGLMAIAIAFSLLGVGIFLATNNPFSMLSATNTLMRRRTRREQRSWRQGKRCLPIRANGSLEVSTWDCSWCRLRV